MAKPTEEICQSGKLTIRINRKTCISCGSCTVIAPKTFELDKNCISATKPGAHDKEKLILEAAESCPVEAITVIDSSTNKTLWPK